MQRDSNFQIGYVSQISLEFHHYLNDNKEPAVAHEFEHPIIGQEAVCPDGLGRVVAYRDDFPHQWIEVATYVKNRGCKWAPHNVKLVPLLGVTNN